MSPNRVPPPLVMPCVPDRKHDLLHSPASGADHLEGSRLRACVEECLVGVRLSARPYGDVVVWVGGALLGWAVEVCGVLGVGRGRVVLGAVRVGVGSMTGCGVGAMTGAGVGWVEVSVADWVGPESGLAGKVRAA